MRIFMRRKIPLASPDVTMLGFRDGCDRRHGPGGACQVRKSASEPRQARLGWRAARDQDLPVPHDRPPEGPMRVRVHRTLHRGLHWWPATRTTEDGQWVTGR